MVDMNTPFAYLACSKTKCSPMHLVMYVWAFHVITSFLPDTTSVSKPQTQHLALSA